MSCSTIVVIVGCGSEGRNCDCILHDGEPLLVGCLGLLLHVKDHPLDVLGSWGRGAIGMRLEHGVFSLTALAGLHDAMIHPPGGKVVCKKLMDDKINKKGGEVVLVPCGENEQY